jgi:hypothetical protein
MFAWICTNLTNYQVSFITTSNMDMYKPNKLSGQFHYNINCILPSTTDPWTPVHTKKKMITTSGFIVFRLSLSGSSSKARIRLLGKWKDTVVIFEQEPVELNCWDYLDHKMGQSLGDTTWQRHIVVNWTPENGLRIDNKLKLDLLLPQHFLENNVDESKNNVIFI